MDVKVLPISTLTRVWFMDLPQDKREVLYDAGRVKGSKSRGDRGSNSYIDYIEKELPLRSRPLKRFLKKVLTTHGLQEDCLQILPLWSFTLQLSEFPSPTLQDDAIQRIDAMRGRGTIEQMWWMGDKILIFTNSRPSSQFLESLIAAIG